MSGSRQVREKHLTEGDSQDIVINKNYKAQEIPETGKISKDPHQGYKQLQEEQKLPGQPSPSSL